MMTVPPQLTSSLPSFSYPASFRHPPPASSFTTACMCLWTGMCPLSTRSCPLSSTGPHMFCVNLLAHSRAFRGSQQCRTFFIHEKCTCEYLHIDMQISPYIHVLNCNALQSISSTGQAWGCLPICGTKSKSSLTRRRVAKSWHCLRSSWTSWWKQGMSDIKCWCLTKCPKSRKLVILLALKFT